MRVDIAAIEKQLAAAARRFVAPAEADAFAKLSMQAHLKKAPRMNPLAEAVADLNVWDQRADHEISTLVDKQAIRVLDCNGLAPSLKIGSIHDTLEKRARDLGMAAVGLRNSAGIITLSMWADGLAQRDLIGLALFNGGTGCMVPFGGRRGVLGTNPLAYAVPADDHPIVLDMATTEIPYFEIKTAKEKGIELRENVAVDNLGRPTTDAQAALDDAGVANLLPMGGGVKGYGIAMLVEVLTGALVQSLLSTQQTPGWNPTEYGCILLALDVASFTDVAAFKSAVTDMCQTLRGLPPAEGVDAVIVPGDRGYEKMQAALKTGSLEIDSSVVSDLHQLAGHSG